MYPAGNGRFGQKRERLSATDCKKSRYPHLRPEGCHGPKVLHLVVICKHLNQICPWPNRNESEFVGHHYVPVRRSNSHREDSPRIESLFYPSPKLPGTCLLQAEGMSNHNTGIIYGSRRISIQGLGLGDSFLLKISATV